ncbi:alpha/beta fold hydrolase [Amycolatopsis sp. NPDC049253]|uniref:thioesterase II family protein n=1 Tax=Amycolatopsis sp. NPDC049253 TaxID=3155274 RepID=UPI00343CA12F
MNEVTMETPIAGSRRAAAAGTGQRWLRRFSAPPAPRLRLVCFAHAGGSASSFRTWPSSLPPDVEVLAIRYPGRQDRLAEPCAETLDGLVGDVVGALAEPLSDGVPFAFFGHSMGSAIAFEVAARLDRRCGLRAAALFVSAAAPPHLYQPGTLHLADDDAFVAALRRLGAADGEFFAHEELRAMVLPSIRADFRLIETHRPGPPVPLAVPIRAYSGTGDSSVDVPALLRWAELTTADFTHHAFPGDHFYLVPSEAELLADLARHLP